jgi:hypothetical protein
MIANVRRGDVLVSSSDESENEMRVVAQPSRLRELVSELSTSPVPDTSDKILTIALLIDRLQRKRMRESWSAFFPPLNSSSETTILRLRQLFGFQILTSTLKSQQHRLLSSSFLSFSRHVRFNTCSINGS